ncbi:hypothetical protein FOQG_18772 [Fusarium oxysporum f. sp. raphani 54005]|jgi:hypothetical protein|uniref:Uncharacterized protein n=1 Tax=Fusarium oxysporum f. sp. raphani 54005 TaxID=1089458 RepID=X0C115_FUSOX|nr:hypothetical protein FOQG_18772 [Fusarium oxysporum f. sp. raphani 54005]
MSRHSGSWPLVEWKSNPYALYDRLNTRDVLHETYDKKYLTSYILKMDWIYRSTSKGCFVWALIDSPEEYRVEALRQFKECLRQEYDEAISMIAALQKGNDTSTLEILFQCVAVSEYVRTLPSSAQRCSSCGQATPEGVDIIRRRCQKHIFFTTCYDEYSSKSLKSIYSWCPCFDPIGLGYIGMYETFPVNSLLRLGLLE